jgi:hypothetical protein
MCVVMHEERGVFMVKFQFAYDNILVLGAM